MSDEDRRNEIVTLAVYPDIKNQWESAAQDDPDADSLSQLVRVAVNRYLHDQVNGSSEEVSQEIHEQLTELNTQQEQLAQHLDGIKGQLTDVREAVTGEAVGPETEALADDIFEMLPSKKAHTKPVISETADGVPAPEQGSIEWLSERLDVPRYQIQAALDHLQETTYAVSQTDDGRYYKEV
jgi:predicted transcriptional regulator